MAEVRLENVRKEFGGVVALQEVSLDVNAGEIVALVGDNGAGKSTLIKMIAGVHQPTSGQIVLEGEPVRLTTPTESREHGIEVVYQDLALADQQPVYMNMFLGRELVRGPLRRLDRDRMARETQRLLDELEIRVPSPRATTGDLSGGQRQGVAVSRAVTWASKVVFMDEPTAALGVVQTRNVLDLIRRVRDTGLAVVLISHNMPEVMEVSDRVEVLRLGERVARFTTAETSMEELVGAMTGALRHEEGQS